FAAFNLHQYGSAFGRYAWLDQVVAATLQNFSWLNLAAMVPASLSDTLAYYQAPLADVRARAAFIAAYRYLLLLAAAATAWAILKAIRIRDRSALGAYAVLTLCSLV